MDAKFQAMEEGVIPKIDRNGDKSPMAASPPREETMKRSFNWSLLVLNCSITAVGSIGAPLLLRLYYLNGGGRKWLTGWLQTAGFPLLLLPLSFLYVRGRARSAENFLAEPRLLACSAAIGLLFGLDSFLYAHGLALLPVSTSSLLFSTQLAFTSFFALVIVRQRFSPYSLNAIVLVTLGSVILGLRKSGDRPEKESDADYALGFVSTLGAAALLGLVLPCMEKAYSKAKKAVGYAVVVQFQIGVTLFATLFCTVGMIVSKDFTAISREAKNFGLGEAKYYLVLTSIAVLSQMMFIGSIGIVFCSSSLFSGVVSASLLPFTEIAAVIFFHEKFTGEKGLSLVLCLWGFTSYFYGSYRMERKQINQTRE